MNTSRSGAYAMEEQQQERRKRGDRWLLFMMFALFFIGIGIRGYAFVNTQNEEEPVSSRTLSQNSAKAFPTAAAPSTVSPQPDGSRDPQSFLFSLAPYLTEGGFSFFVGFCLGYFLRLLAKTAMLIVGAVYCCLIILSHYGIITVDWGSFQQILHSLLLNTQTQVESVRQVIQVGLPSAAMGGIGVWRGLKKS